MLTPGPAAAVSSALTVSDDTPPALRVVLADEHAVVLERLKLLVNAEQDMLVVGEAANGEAAVRVAAQLLADVIVMDLSLPILGGPDATDTAARLNAALPAIRIVALTVHEDPSHLAESLKAGAHGYLLKRSAAEHVVHAIRATGAGGIYVDPSVAATVVRGYLLNRRRGGGAHVSPRSDRENAVSGDGAAECLNDERIT